MKKLSLILFATGVTCVAAAQSFDDMMLRKPYVNCKDVTFNAARLIEQLYKTSEIDSLYGFLEYWEGKCGDQEAIYQLRLLLDIKTANFDTTQVSNELFNHLLAAKPSQHDPSFFYPFPQPANTDYDVALKNINTEIKKIAASIEQTYSVDEALIVKFYKSDSSDFTSIKNASTTTSKLKRIHEQEIKQVLRMPEHHIAFFTGYYQPFNKLEVFGPHATLGLMGGFKQRRNNFDLVLDIRMGRSKDEYEFIYNGTLMKDDRWTSIYAGLEYTYNFIEVKKFRVGISPGIGYNGITAVRGDDDEDKDAKTLPSYDANVGLAFKYHFGKAGGYAGLQLRYHWVDHHNAGGTELNGSYLSARLILGSIFNEWRVYKLKRLD